MAMMKCSECGREISDKAKVCPGCGAETDAGRRSEEEKKQDMAQYINATFCALAIIAGLVLLIWGLVDLIPDLGNGYYTYKAPLTDHEKGVIYKIVIGIALIIGVIVEAIKSQHTYKTEWRPPDLSALSGGGSSAMWICPDCNTKNKGSSYTCNRCGYNRIKVREGK